MSNTLDSWISVDFTKADRNCVVMFNQTPVIVATCNSWKEVEIVQQCWDLPIFITSL
jgi:hypothetical protein